MSAVLILTQRDRLTVFADAAAYTPDGVLRRIRSKLIVLAKPACVIIVRGRAPPEREVAWRSPETFDEVKVALPKLASALAEGAPAGVHVEVVAAGVSEFNGDLEAWGTATAEPNGAGGVAELQGYAPGRSLRLPLTWGAPGWDPALAPSFGERWRGVPREEINPERFGVDALTAARVSAQWETPAGEPIQGALVGGFVEMGQVTRAGVARRIIGRWPDRVGEPINRWVPLSPELSEADVCSAFLRRVA